MGSWSITALEVGSVGDFYYLGSLKTADSKCDKEMMHIGRQMLHREVQKWRSNECSMKTKIRLHDV